MNCPKCGSAMVLKEKPVMVVESDGARSLKGTREVWFCRDCKVSINPGRPQENK